MSIDSTDEAIAASQRLVARGEIGAARSVLEGHTGQAVDLQRGFIATEAVLLDGGDPSEVVTYLTPHIECGRAVDLIGTAHFHAAITTRDHTLPEAIGECTSASRMPFEHPQWKVANTLHIGMIQQRQGSHDIAVVYLQDAYGQGADWPTERAMAAHHLGLDARARGADVEAVQLLEEALDLRRLNTLTASIPGSLLALAAVLGEEQPDQAGKLIDEAVELSSGLRVRRPLALALRASGVHHGRPEELDEARSIAVEIRDHTLLSDMGPRP